MNYHATNDYPINLNDVFKMIGFANKGNAMKTIKSNFVENEDLTDNEKKLGYALLEIFTNFESIFQIGDGNKFNKNLILLSLREMTSLSTKEIRVSLKRYKNLYDGILGGFLD